MNAGFSILWVEDSQDHILLIKNVFKRDQEQLPSKLTIFEAGEPALEYLFSQTQTQPPSDQQLPDLILLDIRLPGISGIDVLKSVKRDERLKKIPVIMFTSSDRDEDVVLSYEFGANSYIPKPSSFQGFMTSIRMLKRYWLNITKLPCGLDLQ